MSQRGRGARRQIPVRAIGPRASAPPGAPPPAQAIAPVLHQADSGLGVGVLPPPPPPPVVPNPPPAPQPPPIIRIPFPAAAAAFRAVADQVRQPAAAVEIPPRPRPDFLPAPPVDRALPVRHRQLVNFTLSDDLLRALQADWPEYQFASTHNATPHSHPRLAFERRFVEEVVIEMATVRPGNIVDIGGNPARHSLRRAPVWSTCPVLDSSDAVRNALRHGLDNWCDHRFQDCTCERGVNPTTYISIHSLYYLKRADVLRAVHSCTSGLLIASVHLFPEAYGSFCNGEAQYRLVGHTCVDMTVRGNLLPYSHSSLSWIRDGYYSVGGEAVAWSMVRTFPTSVIIMFARSPSGLPRNPTVVVGFEPSMRSTTYYGSVPLSGGVFAANASAVQTILVNQNICVDTFWSWGKWAVCYSQASGQTYIVPKSLVHELAAFVTGKDRNPMELQKLIGIARNRIRQYDLPPDLVASSIIICAAMAFVLTVQIETTSIVEHIGPYLGSPGRGSSFPMLNGALRFELPRRVTAMQLYRAAFLSSCLIAFCFRDVYPAFSVMMFVIAAGFACYLSVPGSTSMLSAAINNFNVDHVSFRMIEGTVATVPEVSLTTFEVDRPNGALALGSSIRIPVDPGRSSSAPVLGTGIHIPQCLPIVHTRSLTNETTAIANRALARRHPLTFDVDADCVDFVVWLDRNADFLFPMAIGCDIEEELTAGLFHSWNRRFPAARQRSHENALANTYSDYLDARELNSLRSFMKVESLLHSSDVSVKHGDSRPIQGGSDEHAVLVGPHIWVLYKAIGAHFNKNHSFMYLTSGSTSEDLGEWFDVVGHHDPLWHYVDEDFSRWDASVIRFHLMFLIWLYRRFGLNRFALELIIRDIRKRGASAFGIVYTVKNTVASGRDDTSGGNSILHATLGLYLIHRYNCPGQPLSDFIQHSGYRSASCGDDGLYMMRRSSSFCNYHPVPAVDWLEHGLTAEINVRPNSYDLEFCSGRFWPTGHGTVYAVKPGRLFPKLGFYINIHPRHLAATHRATLCQVLRDFSFLPPVVSFAQRQLDLIHVSRDSRVMGTVTSYSIHSRANPRHPCSDDTWAMLDHLYGWTHMVQDAFDALLLQVTSLPSFIQFAFIDNMISRDTEVPGVPEGLACVSLKLIPAFFAYVVFIVSLLFDTFLGRSTLLFQIGRICLSDPWCSRNFGITNPQQPVQLAVAIIVQVFMLASFEEVFKRLEMFGFAFGWYALVGFEDAIKVYNGEFLGALFSTLCHYYYSQLGPLNATFLHWFVNFSLILSQAMKSHSQ
jgi:hypothetical protein